jgi:hypothetical protein
MGERFKRYRVSNADHSYWDNIQFPMVLVAATEEVSAMSF